MSSHRLGFTIVELLIVIVVIAILAAISIIAYNGIQDRAYASKAAHAASTYANAIKMYMADGGQLSSSDYTCLGDPSRYTATGNFLDGECYVDTRNGTRWESGYKITRNSTVASKLDSYLSSLPDVHFPDANFSYSNGNGHNIRGIYFNGHNIFYVLKGSRDCANANYDSEAGVTWCYVRARAL